MKKTKHISWRNKNSKFRLRYVNYDAKKTETWDFGHISVKEVWKRLAGKLGGGERGRQGG